MIVTGIGSRETPPEITKVMFWIGEALMNEDGSRLRSGGAPGADQAFEAGASASMLRGERYIQEHTEIFLPWASFEKDNRSWIVARLTEPATWAYPVASDHHPSWQFLKPPVRRLMARNVHQVFGPTQTSEISDCIVCWTKGARGGGGTGQAIRIANAFDVPVYDLADDEVLLEVAESFGIPRRNLHL